MTFLKGLLPIIQKKDHLQPISPKSKEEIKTLLTEKARIERLASQSVNTPGQQQYFLEPIPTELFNVFQQEDLPQVEFDESLNELRLLSIGTLTTEEADTEEEEEKNQRVQYTPYTLNIQEYREKRTLQQNTISLIDSPENVEKTEASENVDMAEEYTPNTQDVNNMLNDVLGPEAMSETTAPLPTNPQVEFLPTPIPVNTPQRTTLPPLVPAIMLNRPRTTTTIQPSEPYDPSQPTTDEPATTTSEPVTTVESVAIEPTTSGSVTTGEPVTATESTTTTEPVTTALETVSTGLEWINDEQFIPINTPSVVTPSSKKVYGFHKKMIPVFPTLEQQKECDETIQASKTKTNIFFNIHFDKSINALNFTSNDMDYSLEEQWDLSGKLMVLKNLLNDLLGKDLTLLIVAKDLGEEETLIDLIGNVFQLDCLRLHYVLEEGDGGYGVFVKTLKQVNQSRDTVERGNNFEAVADLIISMDIRISSDADLFRMVSKRGSEDKGIYPPAVWLIAIGSVEHRAFKYLVQHRIPFSDSKSDAFKDLVRQENEWSKDEEHSIEQLNSYVAENVKSWLLSSSHTTEYQYRSTLQLPRSSILGNVKAIETNTSSPENEGNTSDMDIDSDNDLPPANNALSTQVTEFIKSSLFPPFDINQGKLVQVNTEEALRALPVNDLKLLSTLPKNMQTEYRTEVNKLKRQYEIAFEELQQKFREKAVSSMQNQ